MPFFSKRLALVSLCVPLALACSSSDSSSPAAAPQEDAGASADSSAGDSSSQADGAVAVDAAKPSTGPCGFSVSGDRTYPPTDSITCPGYLKQVNGMGSYDINVAAGFESAAGENVNFGFTISSDTPPAAGDKWTLNKTNHTGNLTLTISKGTDAAVWSTSDQDAAGVTDGTTLTIVSATKMMGTVRPQDVYYVFEVTLETTLPGRTAGATSATLKGHFKLSALPLGA